MLLAHILGVFLYPFRENNFIFDRGGCFLRKNVYYVLRIIKFTFIYLYRNGVVAIK